MAILLLAVLPATPAWQIALFGFNLLAFVLLLLRLVYIGLAKAYPALMVWLAINITLSMVPWIISMTVQSYYWFFMFAEGITDFLYLFLALELFGKVLRNLRGFASVARWTIPFVVLLSAAASAALMAFEGQPARYIDWFYRVDRAVITSLIVFLLTITAFMVWFPIRISRNTVVYSVGYAVYLVPTGASMFLRNSGRGVMWMVGTVAMTMSSLCLLVWATNLSSAGESVIVSPGGLFRPHDEGRLIAQLEAINKTLMR